MAAMTVKVLRCPHCGCDRFSWEEPEYGTCSEGIHVFHPLRCADCGIVSRKWTARLDP